MIKSENINKYYLKIITCITVISHVLKNIDLNTCNVTFLILKLFIHVNYG